MAFSANLEPRLEQFTVASVEGMDEGKERGRGCYGAVYEVRLYMDCPALPSASTIFWWGEGKENLCCRK